MKTIALVLVNLWLFLPQTVFAEESLWEKTKETAKDSYESLSETTEETLDSTKDWIDQKSEDASDYFESGKKWVKEKAESASETGESLWDKTKHGTTKSYETIKKKWEGTEDRENKWWNLQKKKEPEPDNASWTDRFAEKSKQAWGSTKSTLLNAKEYINQKHAEFTNKEDHPKDQSSNTQQ